MSHECHILKEYQTGFMVNRAKDLGSTIIFKRSDSHSHGGHVQWFRLG